MISSAKGRIRRSPTAVWREIDGQVVIVSTDVNRARLLNKVGSFVWTRCDEKTVEGLAGELAEHYRIDRARALADVNAFVEDLRSRGMILLETVSP